MRKTALQILACIVFWGYFAVSPALTIAEVELKSYLNQPLDARIALDNISPAELESLEVKFVQAPAGGVGSDIALVADVVNDTMGKYIHISSKQTVREPVVTFTLELIWTTGRMQREYSLLLDPKT